jgi:hypothetical protein
LGTKLCIQSNQILDLGKKTSESEKWKRIKVQEYKKQEDDEPVPLSHEIQGL